MALFHGYMLILFNILLIDNIAFIFTEQKKFFDFEKFNVKKSITHDIKH